MDSNSGNLALERTIPHGLTSLCSHENMWNRKKKRKEKIEEPVLLSIALDLIS